MGQMKRQRTCLPALENPEKLPEGGGILVEVCREGTLVEATGDEPWRCHL